MTTDTRPHAVPASRAVAARLLAFERVLMGVVFLAIGVSGILGLLPQDASSAAGTTGILTSLLAKAGFLFPLLKGAEVLLEQYLAAGGARS